MKKMQELIDSLNKALVIIAEHHNLDEPYEGAGYCSCFLCQELTPVILESKRVALGIHAIILEISDKVNLARNLVAQAKQP